MIEDDLFLIDITFLLKASTETFLKAPLLLDEGGHDRTVMYGIIRGILKLRKELGIRRAIVIVGQESIAEASEDVVAGLIELLLHLKAPVLRNDSASVLDICALYSETARWIITKNWAMCQLSTQKLSILLPGNNEAPEVVSAKTLSDLGIGPEQVPALLALSDASLASLSRHRSIRLLEVYGNLEALLTDVSLPPPATWKKTIARNKDAILQKASQLKIRSSSRINQIPRSNGVFIDHSEEGAEILRRLGYWSLIRLLPPSKTMAFKERPFKEPQLEYFPICKASDFQKLEQCLLNTKVCAIDTETSGKDPRTATLFGVSISVKEGQAFFVPMIQTDLVDLSLEEVRSRLNQILTMKLVGHNLKFDCTTLRRHGINVPCLYFDTMVAAYDCFGDWEFWNLSAIAKKLLGISIKRYRDIVDKGETFLDKPFKEMVKHACSDADITLRLYNVFMQELRKRDIIDFFFSETMEVERMLLDRESCGVRVDKAQLSNVRNSSSKIIDALRLNVFQNAGAEFDIDSPKATAEVFRKLGIITTQTTLLDSQLEVLAIKYPIAMYMVKYRREKRRFQELDTLWSSVIADRAYPSLSQIKTLHGEVTSTAPCLKEAITSGAIVDNQLLSLCKNTEAKLFVLCDLSKDAVLEMDLLKRVTMKTVFPGIADEVPFNDILWTMLLEQSDLAISHRFLISRNTILAVRNSIMLRYRSLFAWLAERKRSILTTGYVENKGRRKYISGLKSSDIGKRNKAVIGAIHWLVRG